MQISLTGKNSQSIVPFASRLLVNRV